MSRAEEQLRRAIDEGDMRTLLIALALAATFVAAEAQERAKRLVILGPAEEPRFSEIAGGLKHGLRDHGYARSTLEVMELKVPRGDHASASDAVQKVAQRDSAVLFVIGSELARVARQVSTELPIVFITPGDPVASGLVASLPRPGGNMTAMTFEFPELSGKRLELLKSLAPQTRRVLVLYDPRDASPRQGLAAAREAALQLGISLIERETRTADEVSRGLEALAEVDAVLAIPGGMTAAHYPEIIRAAHAKQVPTFLPSRTENTKDALASYGASDAGIAREAARLVEKVLKGENAGDLPVERPTRLELVINLRTAKSVGLDIPPELLLRADEVIE